MSAPTLASQLKPLPFPPPKKGTRATHQVKGLHLTASLRVNSDVASVDADCPVDHANPPCPGCKRVPRTIDGERVETYACPRTPTCKCHARARIMRFVVRVEPDDKKPYASLGNRFLVAPHGVLQAGMGYEPEPGEPAHPVVLGSLSALETPAGVLVWGAAIHAPGMNSTYFPVMAVVRNAARPREP